ncbi:MAG: polynucleotide adenylyltransferase, partial [Candidatus Enteromonas sp.]
MKWPDEWLQLARLYADHGFSLWMIGGSSRDLLLGKMPSDWDFVTDATPEQEKQFLTDYSDAFAKFGSLKLKWMGKEADITTLREEGEYLDGRHPSFIRFVTDLKTDSKRRDFTVNALYIDPQGNVTDYHGGLEDLKKKALRFIGDPVARIQEDPLRILRAERFAKRLEFTLEENAKDAMEK